MRFLVTLRSAFRFASFHGASMPLITSPWKMARFSSRCHRDLVGLDDGLAVVDVLFPLALGLLEAAFLGHLVVMPGLPILDELLFRRVERLDQPGRFLLVRLQRGLERTGVQPRQHQVFRDGVEQARGLAVHPDQAAIAQRHGVGPLGVDLAHGMGQADVPTPQPHGHGPGAHEDHQRQHLELNAAPLLTPRRSNAKRF